MDTTEPHRVRKKRRQITIDPRNQTEHHKTKRRRRIRGLRLKMLKNIFLYTVLTSSVTGGAGYLIYNYLEENRDDTAVNALGEKVDFTPRTHRSPDLTYRVVRNKFPEMFTTDFMVSYVLLNDGRIVPSEIHFFLPVEALSPNLLPSENNNETIAKTAKQFTMSYTLKALDIGERLQIITNELLEENIVRCQSYAFGHRESKFTAPEVQTEWVQLRLDLNIGCGRDQ